MNKLGLTVVILGLILFVGCGGGGNPESSNKSPKAFAGQDVEVKKKATIKLNGRGEDIDGSIIKYEWKKGSKTLATTSTLEYTPTVVGKDTLTLIVTNDDNATGEDTVEIKVKANDPKAFAGQDLEVKKKATIKLNGRGEDIDGSIIKYEWKKGSKTLATTSTLEYTPTVVGKDTLTLIVTDDDNATGEDTVEITVLEDEDPVINAKDILISIEGNTTRYEIQVTDAEDEDSTLDIKWKGNGNIILSEDMGLDISGFSVGLHPVSIATKDSAGNISEHNMSIVIFKNISPNSMKTVKTGQVDTYWTNDDGELQKGIDKNYIRDDSANIVFDLNRHLAWEDRSINQGFLSGYNYSRALITPPTNNLNH